MTPSAYGPIPDTEVNPILDEALDRMIDGRITIEQARERFEQYSMRGPTITHRFSPPEPEKWSVCGMIGEVGSGQVFWIEARTLPQLVEAGRIALEVRNA